MVRRTAILLDQNAKRESDRPWKFYLLVDGQFAGAYTQERLVKAATTYPSQGEEDKPLAQPSGTDVIGLDRTSSVARRPHSWQ